jgi:hypothetical protein
MRLPATRLLALPTLLSLVLLPALGFAQAVPQPFPTPTNPDRSGQATRQGTPARPPSQSAPPPATAAPAPADTPAPEVVPTEATMGAPIYPKAQFIASYNAGQGQRYYLFGTAAAFADVVTFYRTALRQRGELVFEEPATHMFEIGRYREDTMAFPPGVTVKDYTWGNLGGYLNPKLGAQPARFPTIIQMVPVVAEGSGAR